MNLTNEQRDWLTLALVPGVGSTHFIRLLARFQSPALVLNAGESALRDIVGKQLAQRIVAYSEVVDLEGQIRALRDCGGSIITMNDPAYPLLLGEIYDPPLVLFSRGQLFESDRNAVAIVGTRKASPYGIRMAEKLGRELAARSITVVSGMALGIDTAAHRGALDAGGRTIAVLGCGVDVVYPPRNADLVEEIATSGCVLSQFPMGSSPSRNHFPIRNRILSGMTLGTLVVQAPIRSGALITAHAAVEQGREVFAVPGEIGVYNSQGPHALIREGAKLVETVDDILVELNIPSDIRVAVPQTVPAVATDSPTEAIAPNPAPAPALPGSEEDKDILSVLAPNGSYVDEIAAACRVSISEALSRLTMLELKGLVRQFSGKRFAPK